MYFRVEEFLRRRSDSNRRIKVLQTFALDHLATAPSKKENPLFVDLARAGDETRTRDIHVGNVMLYQLSYSRINILNY